MPPTSELFRFRTVRNIQAQQLKIDAAVDLSSIEGLQRTPSNPGSSNSQVIDPRKWNHWLVGVSNQLALQGDAVDPAAVIQLLPNDWKAQVAAPTWKQIQTQLATAVVNNLQSQNVIASQYQVSLVEGLARLIRVHDLVATLATDSSVSSGQRKLKNAADVKAQVAHKLVTLPTSCFVHSKSDIPLVRQPALTDLYIVKDEWNRYEPGELSRIINVLPGETFETKLKHFEKTDTTASKTTTTSTSQTTDNSQTQSSTLSQASTKNASLNIGVQGQVEVSGQYGPTQVKSSLGAQLQSSQSDSETSAFSTATETVQRSVKQVSETVVEAQTKRTVIGDAIDEDHKLGNTGSATTVGLYRWLSEIHRMQLMKYPNRFVLEFEIPEPGTWLRWAMQNAPVPMNNPDPGLFRLAGASKDLSPLDLRADAASDTIAQLSTQWRIQGLPTPPPQTVVMSVVLKVDPTTQNQASFAIATDSTMNVPNGYVADNWTAEIFSTRDWAHQKIGTELTITVGGGPNGQSSTGDLGTGAAFVSGPLNGNVGNINTGTIPVSVYTLALQGFTCVVNVTCKLMPETFRQWQQSAFDQIAAAYQSLQLAYRQELESKSLQPGALSAFVGSPDLNRARATSELRRLVIESLMNQRLNGEDAIDRTSSSGEPMVKLSTALNVAPIVQFFEQAFEWENLIYICYPYYWAGRAQWPTNALTATSDPEFDQFLNSGSARVVVPARPGFEHLVNYYLYTGVIWGGSQPPAPNDPDYLSVAQEIQSLQTAPSDGTPVGSSWEVSLPTTLIWAGSDPSTLPTNPNPTIPAPTQ